MAITVTNKGYNKLVDWVKDNGGRVDDRLGLVDAIDVAVAVAVGSGEQHEQQQLDTPSIRGCVALEDIAAGTELLYCPWTLVLGTIGDTSKVPADHCQVLQTYAHHIRLGTESFWHPYLSMDDSLASRIPTVWADVALQELQGLPPYSSSSSSLTDWFSNTCAGGTPFCQLDDASRQSLLAAITRSAGMRFLPIFDLINHDNGRLNTRSNASKEGNQLFALVDIAKGSNIYVSYRGQRSTSSDIFMRYGFVESWPQQWSWLDDDEPTTTTLTTMPPLEQRILVLSRGSVAIYPPETMTMWIGSDTMLPPTLEELQEQADHHNMQLTTLDLVRFRDSAIRLLQETRRTSVEDDIVILETLEQELKSETILEEQSSVDVVVAQKTILVDRICAVNYRIHTKKAIHMAVQVANDVLARQERRRQEEQANQAQVQCMTPTLTRIQNHV